MAETSANPPRKAISQAPSRKTGSRRPAKSGARLIEIGTAEIHEYPLKAGRTLVGSAKNNDIVLESTSVSRHHGAIQRRRGRYSVVDFESTNGTFLNGRRVRQQVALRRGDEVRFGTVRFAFTTERNTLRPAFLVSGLVILFIVGFVGAMYFIRQHQPQVAVESTPAPIPARSSPQVAVETGPAVSKSIVKGLPLVTPLPSTAMSAAQASPTPAVEHATTSEPPWLALLNHYRATSGLDPVAEDPALSAGDRAHVQYLLTNFHDAFLNRTMAGEDMHRELSGKPGYTAEGAKAATESDVDLLETFRGRHGERVVIDTLGIPVWISGAFHRLNLLSPKLHRVGYAQLCTNGLCVAALNGVRGADLPAGSISWSKPMLFPADGSEIDLTEVTNEWPSPVASCKGYAVPTGLAVTVSLGNFVPARLDSFSFSRIELDGTTRQLEACGFDASSYQNADPIAQSAGRDALHAYGAVAVIPRNALAKGATYHVTISVNGKNLDWKFKTS